MSAELALAVAGEALGALTYKIGAAAYGELFSERHDFMVSASALLFEDEAGTQVALTDEQVRAIGEFIKTPEVTAIAQTYTLGDQASGSIPETRPLTMEAKDAFVALFTATFPQLHSSAETIWNLITEALKAVAPIQGGLRRGKKEDLTRLFDSQEEIPERRPPAPRYIREILLSTADWTTTQRLRQICADACRAAEEEFGTMHLEHTQDNHRFSRDDLYVERTLLPTVGDNKRPIDASIITDPTPGTNAVVIGHPGAGKSTLVSRALYQQATRPSRDLAPIILRCRELNSDTQIDLIVELAARLEAMPGVSIQKDDTEKLLSLGRALLVFDGIDEVVDLQRRRRLVASIESLAAAFPLAPIVCTTRLVGYESAEFTSQRFSLYVLDDYSEAQVEEYAKRWFAVMRRPHIDSLAFLQDSEEVREIRRNPLMLSLLCTLYRVRGYIPMNRLDVYKSCADLLFYSWDSLRHIPQPVDHRRYGHTLMEELADLFFKFPSAGAGIEEGMLVRLIAAYFKDTAGVEPQDATTRAEEFLNFCAGRAWLLTAIGRDSRGQRVFAFTHRTFMEFYAARAIVRRARSEEDVLRVIYDVYRKNPSSVLPDIMVQAYDEKEYRGAETLLRSFKKEGRAGRKIPAGSHFQLCLRILNSTPVGAPLVREVLVEALTAWQFTDSSTDRTIFISLLQLYKDPRNICQRMLAGADTAVSRELVADFRKAFLRRWARLSLLAQTEVFREEWGEIADLIAAEDGPGLIGWDPAVYTYLTLNDIPIKTEARRLDEDSILILHCFGAIVPGLLVRAIRGYFAPGQASKACKEICLKYGGLAAREPIFIDSEVASVTHRLLTRIVPEIADVASDEMPAIKALLFWLACLMTETSDTGLHPYHEMVRAIYPDDLLYRILRRRMRAKATEEGAAEELRALKLGPGLRREVTRNCPRWAARWMNGALSLTRDLN